MLRWLIRLALLAALAGCGLEPVYVTQPPEVADGAFRWLDALAAPPEGYAQVTFTPPDGAPPVGVCRANRPDPNIQPNYQSGQLQEAGCLLAEKGAPLLLPAAEGGYEVLWARLGAPYRWEPLANLESNLLLDSPLYRNNRVPIEPRVDLNNGRVYGVQHPCATLFEGRWAVGGIDITNGVVFSCYLIIDGEDRLVRDGILVLYAPAAPDP